MSSTYVSAELRRLIANRADWLCEYCLIHEADTYFGCQVDHIISEKHNGSTTAENLAYACLYCNRFKGSDIGSITGSGDYCRFFNPRTDHWADHFRLDGVTITPLTEIGEVTERILQLNHVDRLLERRVLQRVGHFPNPASSQRMKPSEPRPLE
jgi:HNH endonuclease